MIPDIDATMPVMPLPDGGPWTHDASDSGGWRHSLAVWRTVFTTALAERLVYRGDFALGTLMRFLPIVTQIFLWYAVYDAAAHARGMQADPAKTSDPSEVVQIGGYNFRDMVAYFLLTMIARAFSSMPSLASGIAQQIRDGEIKRYLIQPIDWIGFLLINRIAHKVAYYAVAIAPFALVFFLCRDFFMDGFPPWPRMLAFVASLIMGFLIGFFLEAAIGMIGFWFLEVSSLLFLYMLFSFFLSGHMFPLSLLPPGWDTAINLLPLKYLAYFPAAVFLGKIPDDALPYEMAVQAAWVLFFIVLCRWTFHRGVARYSGYGG